jgi:hypothetical protein
MWEECFQFASTKQRRFFPSIPLFSILHWTNTPINLVPRLFSLILGARPKDPGYEGALQ